jgi:phosphatidylglycerol---prolipoprotein diacylglyceryl transferase
MTHDPRWHLVFEMLSYFLGFQLYLREKRRLNADPAKPGALSDQDHAIWVLVGAVLGAALGSKLLYWFELPQIAFANFPDLRALMAGKSVVGGFLGGLIGVECVKKIRGIARSTGDAMAIAILLGLAIGRIGCFAAGLSDNTYGNPTNFIFGYDFGDGLRRHPTQLYEIVFAVIWAGFLIARRPRLARTEGDLFKAALAGYLCWRLGVEWIKPMTHNYFGLSGIQWACLAGLGYYAPHVPRLFRALWIPRA